jgi:flagellar biosynthesis/type III secretory pathway protein FliH
MREKVMQLTNPFIELGRRQGIEQGREQGIEKGRHEGEVELVLRQLSRRLGAVSTSQKKLIQRLGRQRSKHWVNLSWISSHPPTSHAG